LRVETGVAAELGPVSVDPPWGADVRLVHVLVLAPRSVEVASMLLGGNEIVVAAKKRTRLDDPA
jgi:hypothetical protein